MITARPARAGHRSGANENGENGDRNRRTSIVEGDCLVSHGRAESDRVALDSVPEERSGTIRR